MVLDTHTHAWGEPSYDHPWVNGTHASLLKEFSVEFVYTAERLQQDMDRAGVDEAVVVGYPIYDWTDNSYVRDVVERYDALRGVAMLDAFADDAPETVRDLMAVDGMVGVRLGCQFPREHEAMWWEFDESADWLRDAVDRDDLWAAVADAGALVQLFVHHSQLDQVRELVEARPEPTYVVDHWAHLDDPDGPDRGGRGSLAALSGHENVAVKASATPMVSEEGFPYRDMHGHLRWLLEEFGRERVIWGSDFPNVSHPEFGNAEYADALDWLAFVEGVSDADRAWLTERSFDRHLP